MSECMGVGATEFGKRSGVWVISGQASGRGEPSWLGVGHLRAKSRLGGLELLSSLDEDATFGVRARPPLGLV